MVQTERVNCCKWALARETQVKCKAQTKCRSYKALARFKMDKWRNGMAVGNMYSKKYCNIIGSQKRVWDMKGQ
mgnify:FL=1